jgi:hypothetical protein
MRGLFQRSHQDEHRGRSPITSPADYVFSASILFLFESSPLLSSISEKLVASMIFSPTLIHASRTGKLLWTVHQPIQSPVVEANSHS